MTIARNGHRRRKEIELRRSNSLPNDENNRIRYVLSASNNNNNNNNNNNDNNNAPFNQPNYNYNRLLLAQHRQNTARQYSKQENYYDTPNHPKTPALGMNAKLFRKNLIGANFSSITNGQMRKYASTNMPHSAVYVKPKPIKVNSGRHFMLAIVFLFGGLVMFASFDPMMDFILDSQMQIKQNRILSLIWRKNPMAIFADFYLFELTNAEDYLKGAKPIVQEHGPFTFDLYRKREVLEWGEQRVKFMEDYDFVPNEDRAVVSIDTRIKILNYPLIVAINTVKKILNILYVSFLDPIVSNIVSIALRATGETLIEHRTAKEILSGREIKIISYLEAILQPMRDSGIPVPKLAVGAFVLQNSTFGFMELIDDGVFGPFESYASTTKGHVATHFYGFKGSQELPNFKYPCNRMYGSGGVLYGRNLKSSTIAVYNQLACRPLIFKQKRVEYFKGIRTIRFELDEQSYSMSAPRYQCFCFDRSLRECEGWINAAGCYEGIDIGMSLPHYLFSRLRQWEVGGLQPNVSQHLSYFNIEPNLGVPVNAALNLQANIPIKKSRWVPGLSKVPEAVLPVFWISIHLGATTVQATGILIALNGLLYGSYGFLLGSIALSGYQVHKGIKKRNIRIHFENQMLK